MLLKHLCLQVLLGEAVAPASLVVGVPLVSILQTEDWARVSTLARLLFFPLHYYYRLASGLCTVCHAGPQ